MIGQQLLLRNGRIYTPHGIIEQGHMLVNPDGTIDGIYGQPPMPDMPDADMIDLDGRMVIPGFIDVHIHGGNGFHVMNGTYEDLDGISRFHAQHGTTAFLATTVAASEAEITRALQCAAHAIGQSVGGAALAGIHLEGPFLNEKRKGAMNAAELREPSRRELEHYLATAEGHLRLVTLAPELRGGGDAVRLLVERGVTVSIGHSDATYSETVEAVKLGVTHTTHHFNGMRPWNHREPGISGAGLMLPQLTTELIADGAHVHPAVVKFLFETKGEHNVCVITDAVSYAGMPDGEYSAQRVVDGIVYLKGTDSLAGSTLTMLKALHNVMRFTGYPLEKVLPSLTIVPARQVGLSRSKGSLETGKDADFLIMDHDFTIDATYVKGRKVYHALSR